MVLVQCAERVILAHPEVEDTRLHQCSPGGEDPRGDQVCFPSLTLAL